MRMLVVFFLLGSTGCGKGSSKDGTPAKAPPAPAAAAPAPAPVAVDPAAAATPGPGAPADGASPSGTPETPAPAGVDPSPMTSETVITHNADRLVMMAAKTFDLAGKIVRYEPAAGGYALSLRDGVSLGAKGAEITDAVTPNVGTFWEHAYAYTLPFAFNFGPQAWTSAIVNVRGCLSFGKPEHETRVLRDTWPSGGLVPVGSAMDLLARDGKETLICALWTDFLRARYYVTATADAVTFTWEADWASTFKKTTPNGEDADLRTSTFQIRLEKSGAIEMAYPELKEEVGITGLFPGTAPASHELLAVTTGIRQGTAPASRIKALRVFEEGSVLRWSFEMEEDVPATESQGSRYFRVYANHDDPIRYNDWSADLTIGTTAKAAAAGLPPAIATYKIAGKTADVFVTKDWFRGDDAVRWAADFYWAGGPEGAYSVVGTGDGEPFPTANYAEPRVDLSAPTGKAVPGNVYEIFHYTVITRDPALAIQDARREKVADEDYAIVFSEFPLDDIHGAGGATSALNVPVKGLGHRVANPGDLSKLGITKLQGSAAVVPLWHPTYDETVTDEIVHTNYGTALSWMTHEIGHRFGVQAIVNVGGQEVLAGWDGGHWHTEFNTPTAHPVSSRYGAAPYEERSPMGGNHWIDNGDGTFTRNYIPNRAPMGMSPLDLYLWGLLDPKDVPESFVIQNLQQVSGEVYSGTKLPIRIEDIIAAQGAREPAFDGQLPKVYRWRTYLLHFGEAPRPESVARAEAIDDEVRVYYRMATGDRLEMR